MFRQSSNENGITIPANVLKNFNVYDILEPQKKGANSDAPKVDKLIDIDDSSTDSGFQDSDLNPSFLDKNRDFDLIDLFQNIFVSPQHIKQKDTTSNDIATDIAASKTLDIDFKQFFDKLEFGQKIDNTNISQAKEETIPNRDFTHLLEKPRVLVPKVFTELDSDTEDLINEILTQKVMEKRCLGEINHSHKENMDSYKNIKTSDVVSDFSRLNLNNSVTKKNIFESSSSNNEPRPSDIKTSPVKSQINNSSTTFTLRAMQKDEKVYKKKRLVKPEHQTAQYAKGPNFYEKSVVLPQIMARMNARQAYLDEKNNQKKRLILDVGANPAVEAECGIPNKTEELRKKTTEKSSLGGNSVKSDRVSYIKDPKLCMNKLTGSIAVHVAGKACVNCCNSCTGKKANTSSRETASVETDKDFGKVCPIVLLEDCNRERLRDLKQSQMFKNFVLNGTYYP